MRLILFFLLVPVFVYGQEIQEEDLELVVDSSQNTIIADSSPKAIITIGNKYNKIMPFLEISFGNIWSKYTDFPDWWNYSLRLNGYGISGGLLYQPWEFLRLELGIRFHKMGNKIDIHNEGYAVEYDTITFEPIDSAFITSDGFFKLNQYYLSLPINANLFLKGLPVYALGGIEIGYLLHASSYQEYSQNEQHFKFKNKNENKSFRPMDFNLNVGSGIRIDLNNRLRADLQLVYCAGVFMINKPDWMVDFMSREVSLRAILAFR